MKRFTAFVLLLILLIGMVACGIEKTDENDKKTHESEAFGGNSVSREQIGEPSPAGEEKNTDDASVSGQMSVTQSNREEITKMYVTVNGNKLEVALDDNPSVNALIGILRQGDIEYTARDYGNFEKVGDIGHTLPQNNEQISTTPGDVILYQGRNICLYYGRNTWSFTRIGRIDGYSEAELRSLLGAGRGNISVKISLL